MEKYQFNHSTLLSRMSERETMKEPPPLLSRLTTPPLRKRERECSKASNISWSSSERESPPAFKRQRRSLPSSTNGEELDKAKAFDSYLTEINSVFAAQAEERSETRSEAVAVGTAIGAGGKTKRIRDEVEELLDQVSRGEGEGEDRDDEPRAVRRRVREDEMPWFNANTSLS